MLIVPTPRMSCILQGSVWVRLGASDIRSYDALARGRRIDGTDDYYRTAGLSKRQIPFL